MPSLSTSNGALIAWIERNFPFFVEHPLLLGMLLLLVVACISWLVLPLARPWVIGIVLRLVRRGRPVWADKLQAARLLERMSWIVPLLIFHQGLQLIPGLPSEIIIFFSRLTEASLLLVMVRSLSALLVVINAIYTTLPAARERPINSYLQIINLAAHVLTIVVMVAVLLGQPPWLFLSGLGAMTAVTLLVFRDTLLSLVAGIQLTTNNLIRLGDWIEMPQFGADGDVVDISLHAVRVQNWDKTITVIPTHKFLDNAFKNWRGMQESGGRRIKRAFNIDVSTIRFLSDEEVEHFGRYALLRDYIAQKREELEEHNLRQVHGDEMIANERRLTNVGTLRAYIVNYLRQHPKIHQGMTFIVRQLEPNSKGLPIEIYVFVADTGWVAYEGVQADVFDHILAIVPAFGLSVYQEPSGEDIRLYSAGKSGRAPGI